LGDSGKRLTYLSEEYRCGRQLTQNYYSIIMYRIMYRGTK